MCKELCLAASVYEPIEFSNLNLTVIYLILDTLQEDKEKYKKQRDTGEKDERQIIHTLFKKNNLNPYSQPIYSHFINNPNELAQTLSKSLAGQEQQITRGRATIMPATRSSN